MNKTTVVSLPTLAANSVKCRLLVVAMRWCCLLVMVGTSGADEVPGYLPEYRKKWQMSNGDVVSLRLQNDLTQIQLNQTNTFAMLDPYEEIHKVIQSKNREVLLLLVLKRTPIEGREGVKNDDRRILAFSYSCLIRIMNEEIAGRKQWVLSRRLTPRPSVEGEGRSRVSKIETISDDGRLVELEMAEQPIVAAGQRIHYLSELYDLEEEQRIAVKPEDPLRNPPIPALPGR